MKAKKSDPDRLLIPIFRAFTMSLGFGERSLIVTPERATLWVHARIGGPEKKIAQFSQELSPQLLLNKVTTTEQAMQYGHQAGQRARDVLRGLHVPEAIKQPITDELPITYLDDDGRPYKILKIGANPWTCYWHRNDQWVTLLAATMAEIRRVKDRRMPADQAAQYDILHEANSMCLWDSHGPRHDESTAADEDKRQVTNREKALEVGCPDCFARAGEPCSSVGASKLSGVHPGRYRAIHPWRQQYPSATGEPSPSDPVTE